METTPAQVEEVRRRAPLARRRSGKLLAGVAGGVADHLGVEVLWVRAAFVLLALMNGAGVVGYALLWIVVRPERPEVPRPTTPRERQEALGLGALGIAAGIIALMAGNGVASWIVGPLGVAAFGAAVVWREADDTRRKRWTRSGSASGGRPAVIRALAGGLFVAGGISVYLFGNIELGQVQFALLAVLVTLVGVAVLTVPWWVRLARELTEERRVRIIESERAEIAAHLHDSVLQTLALIQRQSESPREVARLARAQERELRHWLYGPNGYGGRPIGVAGAPGTDPAAMLGGSLTEVLAAAAAEVEDTYSITVNPVVVGGDREIDDGLRALVLAGREAMVNAAKHAGVAEVSVYCEVEPEEVHLFVRDRGKGFDPDAVPDDRHGLADSVHGRMNRHGGTVRLRSAPGEGTEVQLRMPGQPAERTDEPQAAQEVS